MNTPVGVFVRLSVMLLLGYMAYGAWYATLGLVLNENGLGSVIGVAFSLAAVAAIVSPMFLGAVADRFFASQRVLSVLHVLGAVIMFVMPAVVSSGNAALTLALILVYMLFFMPTLALMSSISLVHVGKHENLYPYVRAFGPLGWALAGLAVGAMGLSASTGIFVVSGVLSVVLAAYSLTLPKTPPPARGARFAWGDVIGYKALYLFKNRNFLAVAIGVLLTCIPIAMYNSYGSSFLAAIGIENVSGVLSIGALSELLFILTIPLVLRFFGIKWAIFTGLIVWSVRFGLFMLAVNEPSWAIVSIALHGICNDFILIIGAMYMNRLAMPSVRAQAQSLFIFLTGGVGTFIGSLIAGEIYNGIVAPAGADDLSAWNQLWIVPLAIAAVAALVFALAFSNDATARREAVEPDAALAVEKTM
jgi:nucleoside transporter